MNNSPIFCSYDFLLEFIKSRPERSVWDDDDGFDVENWQSFRRFLRSNTLRMDKTPGEVASILSNKTKEELDTDFLARILHRVSEGKLRAKQKELFDLENFNKSSIVLSSDRASNELEGKGVLRLLPMDTLSRNDLYMDSGIAVEENSNLSWEEIVNASIPKKCYNSLIIIDNYVTRNTDENLGSLLRQLLPHNLGSENTFHLCIVCLGWMLIDNRITEIDLNHARRIPLDAEHIKSEFLNGYSYNIDVEVLKINPFVSVLDRFGRSRLLPLNKPFHDRAIISNYNFLIAPGGLDLIDDEKSGKMTVVYGLYPDFAREEFKTKYLFNNLYAIVTHQGSSLNNPIIKQYMTSFDYLWRKAQSYRESIKNEEPRDRMYEQCLKEIEHGEFNEATNILEVWDKNEIYQRENRIQLWGSNRVLAISGSRTEEDGKRNQFLDCKKLLPEHIYYVDSDILRDSTGACYQTDNLGRVIRMQVSLPFNVGMVRPVAGESTKRVCSAKDGESTDVGGHILARMLNGPNEAINILPMTKNVNDNFVGGVERIIKGKLEEHKYDSNYSLFLDFIITYEENATSFRPCAFRYIVTEKPSEEIVVDLSFNNQN